MSPIQNLDKFDLKNTLGFTRLNKVYFIFMKIRNSCLLKHQIVVLFFHILLNTIKIMYIKIKFYFYYLIQ